MSSVTPTVSIVCITYNHAPYIVKALEGFLMQKTSFPFEVIIHDDASTDGTTEILKDYATRYSDIIKPYFENKNQYSSGDYLFINRMYHNAKGKYIAFCEGDDFWTSESKLQKQVDYMEKHPGASLCFHPVEVFFEKGEKPSYTYPDYSSGFTTEALLKSNFIQSNSVLYRRLDIDYRKLPSRIIPSDWYMHLLHARSGRIGFLKQKMSAYRRQQGGVWWNAHNDIDSIWTKYGLPHVEMYVELLKLFAGNKRHAAIIYRHLSNISNSFIEVDRKRGSHLLRQTLERFPAIVEPLMIAKYETIHEKEMEIIKLNQITQNQKDIYEKKNRSLQDEISMIKSSKFWKARNVAAGVIGKKKV